MVGDQKDYKGLPSVHGEEMMASQYHGVDSILLQDNPLEMIKFWLTWLLLLLTCIIASKVIILSHSSSLQ